MNGKQVAIQPVPAFSEKSILDAMNNAEGAVLRWIAENKSAEIISVAPACWVDDGGKKDKYSWVFTVTYRQ
jgi:hypothetical protein